jgi:predicted DNA binding CopG/RHH family protein
MNKIRNKGKPFPHFATDAEAERFVDEADLSEYDFSDFKPATMEDLFKEIQMNVRVPEALYKAIKQEAARRKMPYSRFVRSALEAAVGGKG